MIRNIYDGPEEERSEKINRLVKNFLQSPGASQRQRGLYLEPEQPDPSKLKDPGSQTSEGDDLAD
jgi:hypothetical protein